MSKLHVDAGLVVVNALGSEPAVDVTELPGASALEVQVEV